MRILFGYSPLRLSILIGAYILLLGVFSVKTLYYFSYQNTVWWGYFFVFTLAFGYAAYHCVVFKPFRVIVLVVVSLLIAYMPYEVEIVRLIELIKYPTQNLSDIAEKMPLALGVLLDIVFYPTLTIIPLMLLNLTVDKSINEKRGKSG